MVPWVAGARRSTRGDQVAQFSITADIAAVCFDIGASAEDSKKRGEVRSLFSAPPNGQKRQLKNARLWEGAAALPRGAQEGGTFCHNNECVMLLLHGFPFFEISPIIVLSSSI